MCRTGRPVISDIGQQNIIISLYQNIYVPVNGYAELSIKKVSETELHLIGEKNIDYGVVKFKDEILYIDSENFPFFEWK